VGLLGEVVNGEGDGSQLHLRCSNRGDSSGWSLDWGERGNLKNFDFTGKILCIALSCGVHHLLIRGRLCRISKQPKGKGGGDVGRDG